MIYDLIVIHSFTYLLSNLVSEPGAPMKEATYTLYLW